MVDTLEKRLWFRGRKVVINDAYLGVRKEKG